MPTRTVPGFRHVQGLHCGSTAMADALRHAGVALSEAMAFGLGSGIHFFFFQGEGFDPSRGFYGRSAALEYELCERLGVAFDEGPEPDPEKAWARVRAHVDAGRPVLLQADIKFLDYWQTQTSFNGHRLICAGYEDGRSDGDVALMADSHWAWPQEVPAASLMRAMASDAPPVPSRDCYFGVLAPPARALDARALAPEAWRVCSRRMLEDDSGFSGLRAMRAMAGDLARWSEAPDWAWCARFAYQVIEKRGTGGGNFRRLYRAFLEESLAPAPLVAAMGACADAWTALASELKRVSEQPAPDFARAADLAGAAVQAEERYHTEAAS